MVSFDSCWMSLMMAAHSSVVVAFKGLSRLIWSCHSVCMKSLACIDTGLTIPNGSDASFKTWRLVVSGLSIVWIFFEAIDSWSVVVFHWKLRTFVRWELQVTLSFCTFLFKNSQLDAQALRLNPAQDIMDLAFSKYWMVCCSVSHPETIMSTYSLVWML